MERALEELRDLLQEKSIRKGAPGEFRLASGETSSYYCDTKQVTLSPRGARLIAEVLLPAIRDCGAEAVGGLAMGALFVSSPIVLASEREGPPLYGFAVRQEQKEHGLEQSIEESFHPDGRRLLSPGRKVAVVDDVVTTAGSVLKAVQAVQERGCAVVSVLALVDRRAGGGKRLREKELPYASLFNTDAEGDLRIAELWRRSHGRGLRAATIGG